MIFNPRFIKKLLYRIVFFALKGAAKKYVIAAGIVYTVSKAVFQPLPGKAPFAFSLDFEDEVFFCHACKYTAK